MAHRSQSSSIGDNPLDPNYLPPHYREEYRLAIDALIENDIQGYYEFLQSADVVNFLAQPEIEFIKGTIQAPNQTSNFPELTFREGAVQDDGSSDTYWPVQSDMAAPGLDLGWPLAQHSFVGPTEVTTLVNPSDPDMPSIKEQARRLIKNACQVIAVVMDRFTDVDIFSDLLDATARHVPVYIILDEQEAHHFVNMVIGCKVNLDLNPMIRVRTVAGITYYSRTGKSFKGQVKDRFLLADCRAVLSGNYSFMWSYEKIHRCIAHLFLGELVSTFDEEFRILFAQSEPLVIDPSNGGSAMSDTSSTGSYFSSQFGLKRNQALRNPLSFRRQPELPSAFPYGDSNLTNSFRRNDPFRLSMEPGPGITVGKYSQQQFRVQQSFMEQGKSVVSRQMEMSAFKRHSYAEGTQENYSSSRQYMKHRVMNNLEETDFKRESTHFYSEGPGPGSGHSHFDRLRGRSPQLSIDQHSDSSFRSDQGPPPGHYGRDFSSDDLKVPDGNQAPLAGRYGGGSSHKRSNIGQAYACQSSPTQPHLPEKKTYSKQFDQEQDQDPDAKKGLRKWRINSYLSTYEDNAEEGLVQPMGPDAFEEPPPSQQPTVTESSAPYRPRYGKPILPENSKDSAQTANKESGVGRERDREPERGAAKEVCMDVEVKETPDLFLSKHESFRSRLNPLLQRSSRLRSSLIFSSSKAEMHSGGLGLKVATEEDDELDSVRTSSIVTQILEKRRSWSNDPIEERKKAEEKDKEKQEQEKEEKKREQEEKEKQLKEKAANTTSLNMNDPASRLQYFQELAAKRKASKMGAESAPEPAEKKLDVSDKHLIKTVTMPKIRTVSLNTADSESKKPDISAKLAELTRKASLHSSKPPISSDKPSEITKPQKEENVSEKKDIFKSLKPLPSPKLFKKDTLKIKGLNPRPTSCDEGILSTDATDAEKSEMKKNRTQSSSTLQRDGLKEGQQKVIGSNTSLNTLGEGRGEGKTLDFLKKQTQRLKGFLGPKDKEKKSSGDDKTTVIETTGDSSKKQSSAAKQTGYTSYETTSNHKPSTTISSRFQPQGSSVIFNSNLRDDTKVILEQISANSQKNRLEQEKTGGDSDSEKGQENSVKKNRFLRPVTNVQEREGLLKRMESMRKEKKVYSRFEMGNTLG